MQLAKDGMAQSGCVIWARNQTGGKGQRGKDWQDNPGNLKFSLIVSAEKFSTQLFQLNMLVAVTLAELVKTLIPATNKVFVKWPNDIYINDKKTCGILIENIFRGGKWIYAIIGIGLNVNQTDFPENLSKATSLSRESAGAKFELFTVLANVREQILSVLTSFSGFNQNNILERYNALLFKRGEWLQFKDRESAVIFKAKIAAVDSFGQLVVEVTSGIQKYPSGQLEWLF